MSEAKSGDKVKVHYTGKLKDGEIFDSSANRDPLEFTLGEGMVIPGFDKALLGMSVGDKKTVEISVEEGYGPKSEDMIIKLSKTQFPEDLEIEVGRPLALSQMDGSVIEVTVADIGEEEVTLDANHPLAGKDLVFDIELIGIV